MFLSKTDFLHYLHCPKSLWLLKHKPDQYPHGVFSEYIQKIIDEGYEVEEHFKQLILSRVDTESHKFQRSFKSNQGLFAQADCVRDNGDGTITIYEVKSSTSVQRRSPQNQVKDAAFQRIVAEKSGFRVAQVLLVHLNGDYVRNNFIEQNNLLNFVDVSDEIEGLLGETIIEIDAALELLKQTEIDETFCSCLELSKSNHCDTFGYFNPRIPDPSIYSIPRISRSKIRGFASNQRFELDQIRLDEVTEKQSLVLQSAHFKEPIINHEAISSWFARISYPLYFIDYETYASAIPIIRGARPHSPIVFQYSLHIKETPNSSSLRHVEYLAEEAEMPLPLIEHMQENIRDTGSIISWHASFENTQNRNMAEMYPDKCDFLNGIISRTLDLEDIFKEGYVDIKFNGSTSIKKVLPVLVPDLTYSDMEVSNGTDAMEAWKTLISSPPSEKRSQLKNSMLKYCALDTLAMVRIFEFIEDLGSDKHQKD